MSRKRIKGLRIVSNAVKSAYNRSHACSCYIINRDSCLFNDFQGANMGKSFSAATHQYHTNFRTLAVKRGKCDHASRPNQQYFNIEFQLILRNRLNLIGIIL